MYCTVTQWTVSCVGRNLWHGTSGSFTLTPLEVFYLWAFLLLFVNNVHKPVWRYSSIIASRFFCTLFGRALNGLNLWPRLPEVPCQALPSRPGALLWWQSDMRSSQRHNHMNDCLSVGCERQRKKMTKCTRFEINLSWKFRLKPFYFFVFKGIILLCTRLSLPTPFCWYSLKGIMEFAVLYCL